MTREAFVNLPASKWKRPGRFAGSEECLPLSREIGVLFKPKTRQFGCLRSTVELVLCLCLQTEDTLKHKVRNRPDCADVVNMHVLQGEAAPKH